MVQSGAVIRRALRSGCLLTVALAATSRAATNPDAQALQSHVITPDGLGSAFDVQRLENGNTLISGSSGLREIGSDGSVLWSPKDNSLRPTGRACRY